MPPKVPTAAELKKLVDAPPSKLPKAVEKLADLQGLHKKSKTVAKALAAARKRLAHLQAQAELSPEEKQERAAKRQETLKRAMHNVRTGKADGVLAALERLGRPR